MLFRSPRCKTEFEEAVEQWNLQAAQGSARIIRAGSKVRVIRRMKMDRTSQYLKEHWTSVGEEGLYKDSNLNIVPCVLHLDMRISEGLILALLRKAISDGKIKQINDALQQHCAIDNQFYKTQTSPV